MLMTIIKIKIINISPTSKSNLGKALITLFNNLYFSNVSILVEKFLRKKLDFYKSLFHK